MWYDRDWPAAESYFLKAIQMKPDYALAHHVVWQFVYHARDALTTSIREMTKGKRSGTSRAGPSHACGLGSLCARRFDESMRELRKVVASDPEFSLAYLWLSGNFLAKKMWGEAIAASKKFVELSAESCTRVVHIGLAYGSAGMKDEALKILERLDGLPKDRYVGPILQSRWSGLGLGEKIRLWRIWKRPIWRENSSMALSRFGPFWTACALSQGSTPYWRK